MVRNMATDPRFAPWRAEALKRGYASSIGIPLVGDSIPFGALTIYASEPDAFGDEEVQLLTELAGDLAFGVMTLRTKAERKKAVELQAAHEREIEIGSEIQQDAAGRSAAHRSSRPSRGRAERSFAACSTAISTTFTSTRISALI